MSSETQKPANAGSSMADTYLFNQVTNTNLHTAAKEMSIVPSELQTIPQCPPIEKIPYNEGMALYYQIKQRHNDLFHELAVL